MKILLKLVLSILLIVALSNLSLAGITKTRTKASSTVHGKHKKNTKANKSHTGKTKVHISKSKASIFSKTLFDDPALQHK